MLLKGLIFQRLFSTRDAQNKMIRPDLSEAPHNLNTFDCGVGCLHGFNFQRRADDPFQLVMIAFINVIQLLNLSVADTGPPPSKTTAPTLSGSLIRVDEAGELPAFHII